MGVGRTRTCALRHRESPGPVGPSDLGDPPVKEDRYVRHLPVEGDIMRTRLRRRVLVVAAPAAAVVLALAACNSGSGDKVSGPVPTLSGDCAKYQAYAGHSGKTVTMFASIISPESESLQKSWADFSSCTGIKISYEGANEFESQLPVRVTGGNAPDLAPIPQPGLLKQMVQTGKVVKPSAVVTANVD